MRNHAITIRHDTLPGNTLASTVPTADDELYETITIDRHKCEALERNSNPPGERGSVFRRVLTHELMHLAERLMARYYPVTHRGNSKDDDATLTANVAMDYVINEMLWDAGIYGERASVFTTPRSMLWMDEHDRSTPEEKKAASEFLLNRMPTVEIKPDKKAWRKWAERSGPGIGKTKAMKKLLKQLPKSERKAARKIAKRLAREIECSPLDIAGYLVPPTK